MRSAVVAGCLLVLVLAHCGGQPESGLDEGVSSAGDAITESVAPNTILMTTTRVNLRETPSYASKTNILTVMPMGASVTVLEGRPSNGFYNVRYEDQEGWAYGTYLRPSDRDSSGDDAGTGSCADATWGSKLASVAREMEGEHSQGLCYRYVKDHIEAAGVPIRRLLPDQYEASAYMFGVWGKRDPAALASAGFAKSSTSLDALPLGAILVWSPGQCGYSAEHGHIEINIGKGRACSDFCGNIKRSCGKPDIFVPVRKGCQ